MVVTVFICISTEGTSVNHMILVNADFKPPRKEAYLFLLTSWDLHLLLALLLRILQLHYFDLHAVAYQLTVLELGTIVWTLLLARWFRVQKSYRHHPSG